MAARFFWPFLADAGFVRRRVLISDIFRPLHDGTCVSYYRTVPDEMVVETARLKLRGWRESDRPAFARMNADRQVMEFMPRSLSRVESDALADRIENHFHQHGFGLYAAELCREKRFIGFLGVSVPDFEAHFTPCVEIGWKLGAAYWGQGLATEGARAVARYAFESLKIGELVSFTVPMNRRSRRVMEKIGMAHTGSDDFDHPKLPEGDPLRRHVLYRLTAPALLPDIAPTDHCL